MPKFRPLETQGGLLHRTRAAVAADCVQRRRWAEAAVEDDAEECLAAAGRATVRAARGARSVALPDCRRCHCSSKLPQGYVVMRLPVVMLPSALLSAGGSLATPHQEVLGWPWADDPGAASAWWFGHTQHGVSFRDASAYGAVLDGSADSTAALQSAINSDRDLKLLKLSPQMPSAATVFLPTGTYSIADTLTIWFWTQLVGDARSGATLSLPPRAAGYTDAASRKPVVATAGVNTPLLNSSNAWWMQPPADIAPNDRFFISIRNVVIGIGPGVCVCVCARVCGAHFPLS